MKTFKKPVLLVGIVCLVLSVGAGPASAKAKWILKYGHGGNTNEWTTLNEGALFIKYYVEKHTQGEIEVQIYPAFQLGNFRQMMEQVQKNTLEMCHTTAGGASSFMPEFNVVDMPYFIGDEPLASIFTQHPFWKEMSAAFLKRTGNVRWLATMPQGFRNFLTTKPINNVEDLKGKKIRTIESTLQKELVKTLGASSTPIPWPEVYTSLQTGVVDGIKHDVSVIINYKLKPLTHAIIDRHAPLYDFLWISDKFLQSLPPEYQNVVIQGVRESARVADGIFWALQDKHIKEFEKRGGTVVSPTPEVQKGFTAAQKPMEAWFVKQYGDEGAFWLKKFKEAVENCKSNIHDTSVAFGMKK